MFSALQQFSCLLHFGLFFYFRIRFLYVKRMLSFFVVILLLLHCVITAL